MAIPPVQYIQQSTVQVVILLSPKARAGYPKHSQAMSLTIDAAPVLFLANLHLDIIWALAASFVFAALLVQLV